MQETLPNPKIELRDVRKSFGSKTVLGGVNLSVSSGESLVILGGSGSGKSVMLKCILGLISANAGQILVDGKDTAKLQGAQRSQHLGRFGMLFQGSALFDSLPVWQNVAFKLLRGELPGPRPSKAEARDRAMATLTEVGLAPEVGNLFPSELSGGMQKRVALARAIAAQPEIIFFDEPTTGLDPIMSDIINQLIKKCVRSLGGTAISITHDLASARRIADRVAMLYEGKIIWQGSVQQMDHSGNPYLDQFIHGRAEGPIQMQLRKI